MVVTLTIVSVCVASAEVQELDGLRMDVEVRKSEILVGEPVTLSVRFKNVGASPILLGHVEQSAYTGNVAIRMKYETGLEYRHSRPMAASMIEGKRGLRLVPGDSVEAAYLFGASFADFGDARPGRGLCKGREAGNAWCWDFPLPGRYELEIQYQYHGNLPSPLWQGDLKVGGIPVHVSRPSAPIDQVALKDWGEAMEEVAAWRMRGGMTGNLEDRLRPFLRGVDSSSTYSPYARHVLATATYDWKKCLEQLIVLRDGHHEYPLSDEVLFDIAYVRRRMGDERGAEVAFKEAVARNPKNVRARTYEDLP